MAEQSIELVENHGASLEVSSDGYAYSTVEAEFSNIPETGVAIEAQIILFKEDTIVSASDPADCEVTSESPTFWLSDTFFSGTGQVPDSYCVCFRVFKPEDPVSISAPVPPEISRQSGSFLIHEPKKGFLSKEKWNTGSITIESVIVKNAAGDDDEVFINLFSKKPLDSGFRVQAESSGNADETIFRLVDKPHLTSDYLRIHLQEDLNVTVTGYTASGWSMSDKKPFLDIQNIEAVEPEVDDEGVAEEVVDSEPESAAPTKTKKQKTKKSEISNEGVNTSSGSWFETKVTSKSYLTEQFRMAITQFENDGPDEDGDVGVDFTIEIENESSKEISLVKWDLIVDHNGTSIDGNVNNSEECLLDKGDTFEASSYLRLSKAYVDPSKPQLELKGYAKFYEREFLKLGEIEIPEALHEVVSTSSKVKTDFFNDEITISLVRLPDSDESNVKEQEVYLKSSISNKSDFYIEDIEFKCVFIDRTGSEGDETFDYNHALAPNSGAFFQTSFYSMPKSKLKGAKVEFFLKAYRLVGTKIFTDVKTLSL
jgi:hypothetical protein